jgi:hypothetical protein
MEGNQQFIIVPEGAKKRHVIWRVIRLVAYLITFSVAVETFKANYYMQGPDVIMAEKVPTIIALLICHFILNMLYKRVAFRWIFKMLYSKQSVAYLKQAKSFENQNL